MRIGAIIIAALAVLSWAVPADADSCGGCNKSASCGKGVDVYQFQDASDSIAGVHTKLWPMQPMKRWGPAKKEWFTGFQKIADSIKGQRAAPAEKAMESMAPATAE